MRSTTNILLSLVALAPALIAAAPAPQDDTYSTVVESVVVESTVTAPATPSASVLSSAAQPGASGSGACTRRRGGRNRWGQGRPSAAGSDVSAGSGSAPSSASEVASSIVVDTASASATEVAEPTSTIEEEAAEDTAAPSEQVGTVPIDAAASDPTAAPGAAAGGAASGGDQQQPSGAAGDSQGPPASSAAAPEPSASAASGDAGSGSSSGGGGDEASAGFEAEILKAHNDYRAEWSAGPLTWNATSAALAKEHYTANNCVMQHSSLPGLGENLQAGGLPLTGAGAVQAWGPGEENDYTAKTGGVTGHFTQVVWKSSESLGCAHVVCGTQELIACEYFPAGNMMGQEGDNIGPKV